MNKMFFACALTATLFAGHASSAMSANPVPLSDERIDRAIDAQELATALAPIRSKADLNAYLARTGSDRSDPLNALSPRNKQRFVDSLRFGATGLASFSYVELESQLTATQAHRVLALFGAQDFTPQMKHLRQADSTDAMIMRSEPPSVELPGGEVVLLTEHWCESRATCSSKPGSTCIVTSC